MEKTCCFLDWKVCLCFDTDTHACGNILQWHIEAKVFGLLAHLYVIQCKALTQYYTTFDQTPHSRGQLISSSAKDDKLPITHSNQTPHTLPQYYYVCALVFCLSWIFKNLTSIVSIRCITTPIWRKILTDLLTNNQKLLIVTLEPNNQPPSTERSLSFLFQVELF